MVAKGCMLLPKISRIPKLTVLWQRFKGLCCPDRGIDVNILSRFYVWSYLPLPPLTVIREPSFMYENIDCERI